MIRLYEEDSDLFIADRTISLQYRQFRTQRKESKQLILDNKKTYLLSEAEIQKYLSGNFNGNFNENFDENFDKNLNGNILNLEDKICVDIEGFSIDIAKKLGNNYLGNNCILVSTKQVECDSIRNSCSSKHIRNIFNIHHDIIEQILMGEVLIGTVDQKDLDAIIDNPESLFNIEMVFDTPNNAISKLKNIRRDEKILSENDSKLKDRLFLKNLLQNIEDVSSKHGSLDRIPNKEIGLAEKVYFNKLCLDDIDIYCLKSTDGDNIFVYFDNDDKENYANDDLIILNGKNIDSLNVLIELGMVGYSPYLGLERAANMILRNRKEKKEKREDGVEQKNKQNSKQKNRFYLDNDDNDDNIHERAKELLTAVELLVENKRNKDFFINLGQIKIYMTYPLIQNEILYELLTRMENDEYKSCYMNTEKFIQTVLDMNDEQLREFVERILDSLEFIEENNVMANMWLMENRKNVCYDLGIKFVDN